MRGNDLKSCQGRLRLSIREKKIFSTSFKEVKHWIRLPRQMIVTVPGGVQEMCRYVTKGHGLVVMVGMS